MSGADPSVIVRLAVPALLIIVSSNLALAQKPDPMIEQAKRAVEQGLRDPFSVKFQGVASRTVINHKGQPMKVVCGEVNAKNAFGAYVGFQKFIYVQPLGKAYVLGPDRDIATTAMVRDFCS